ncbi:MAG: class I SAM-dependent methyltransferase [Planctomycetes bacterium]|nr:class I SAM-dependent methyltransferase [Planctomycetota bacterium]MBL7044464.1 class I SAM-dependent methyltransferase [Pirellulaceae bacterium]
MIQIRESSVSNVFEFMRQLVRRGGPNPCEYDDLGNAIGQLSRLYRCGKWKQRHSDGLRRMLGRAYSASTLQGFVYHKPHGYAGDYEIIDRIYQRWVSPDPQLRAWDRHFHELPPTKAVRNRKSFFLQVLEDLYRSRSGPLSVLNVASGPCRDVLELLSRDRPRLAFTCVDQDQNAINYASKLLADHAEQVTFVKMNALRCRLDSRFDVVWSAGLFDYFPDRLFVRGLKSLYRHVRPGGELIIGNFSPNNWARDYMELMGEWYLQHRTAEQLCDLAEQAGLAYRQLRVEQEPEAVNLFLRILR